MRKTFFVGLVLALFIGILAGENTDINNTHAFGLHYGTVSGYGYGYRFFKGNQGCQFTLFAMTTGSNDKDFDATAYGVTVDEKTGRRTMLNLGANYLHVLNDFNKSNVRFYLLGGGAYNFYRKTMVYQNYIEHSAFGDSYKKTKNKDTWVLGFGPGIEANPKKNIRLSLELPVSYKSDGSLIMFIPQVGLYYYFK
ncbi:MAG: hypothetical protein PHI68_04265 [Candidatus Cloacimonetes bacterium]|nr:hypothetical protein [Candidatus Cloacimonadota bacterium]